MGGRFELLVRRVRKVQTATTPTALPGHPSVAESQIGKYSGGHAIQLMGRRKQPNDRLQVSYGIVCSLQLEKNKSSNKVTACDDVDVWLQVDRHHLRRRIADIRAAMCRVSWTVAITKFVGYQDR